MALYVGGFILSSCMLLSVEPCRIYFVDAVIFVGFRRTFCTQYVSKMGELTSHRLSVDGIDPCPCCWCRIFSCRQQSPLCEYVQSNIERLVTIGKNVIIFILPLRLSCHIRPDRPDLWRGIFCERNKSLFSQYMDDASEKSTVSKSYQILSTVFS